MKYNVCKWAMILCIAFFISGCANVSSPTGGPKDTTPPFLDSLRSEPVSGALNYARPTLKLTFNEFVELKQPGQKVLISPPLSEAVKYKTKGKTILVSWEEQLRQNTTYSFNFADAIVDLNESNVMDPLVYVFSTGDYLDSASCSGNLYNSETGEPVQGSLFILYESLDDSALYNLKPFYMAISDDDGKFRIDHIKPGKYQAVALLDQNSNYKYDLPNEQIGFMNNIIDIGENEAVTASVYMFTEELENIIIADEVIANGIVKLTFRQPPTVADINYAGNLPDTIVSMVNEPAVLLYYNSIDTGLLSEIIYLHDTLNIDNKLISREFNEFGLWSSAAPKTGRGAANIKKIKTLDIGDSLYTDVGQNIKKLEKRLFELYEQTDSVWKAAPLELDVGLATPSTVKFDAQWNPGGLYKLMAREGALNSYTDVNSKLDSIIFEIPVEDAYGSISLSVSDSVFATSYMLYLLKDDKPIREVNFGIKDSVELLSIQNLKPGKYQLQFVRDENGNKQWTTGNFNLRRQAERSIRYPKTVDVRANWDVELNIELHEN